MEGPTALLVVRYRSHVWPASIVCQYLLKERFVLQISIVQLELFPPCHVHIHSIALPGPHPLSFARLDILATEMHLIYPAFERRAVYAPLVQRELIHIGRYVRLVRRAHGVHLDQESMRHYMITYALLKPKILFII